MPQKFQILEKCRTYQTKSDKTNSPIDILVAPSQNVLINDEGLIETRKGYTRYGAANTATTAIESSFKWKTNRGDEWNLRSYDDELEFYVGTVDGVAFNVWTRLKDGFSAVDFFFDSVWDTTELIDELLFVNGTTNMYSWSGAVTALSSATANTITKLGTNTFAQEGFLTAGTRQVIINGTTYTYTGGESTTTLTGVTPDPSGEAANSLIFQAVRTHANTPASGYSADVIAVHLNQVWAGSHTSRRVYVSKNTSWTDYTYSTPRVASEGALLTLDEPAVALVALEDGMYCSTENFWYKSKFEQITVSTTLVETLAIDRLKTGNGQGALSRDLVCRSGNAVAFVSQDNVFYLLGRFETLEDINLRNISEPIKPDFDDENFTNGQVFFYKNRIYISAPNSDKVYINELRQDEQGNLQRFWQPPQILPMRRLAVISSGLYGHSSGGPETYKLFDGTNDNGNPFTARAAFAYRSYGKRANLKNFDTYFSEGYITANTILKLTLNYDYEGYSQQLTADIDGSDNDLLYLPSGSGGLGDQPLGDSPLGDQPEAQSDFAMFQIFNKFVKKDFFKIQAIYETSAKDDRWKLLVQGGNVFLSKNYPTKKTR